MLIDRLRKRIARGTSEGGFTLIELLVVIIIIGILLAIAVPSYLKFRDRAYDNAAKADIRAAIPAAEAFFADNGTYAGMSLATLKSDYDAGIKDVSVPTATASNYCIQNDSTATGGKQWHVAGPGGTIATGTC